MKRIVKTIACIALVVFSASCQKELVETVNETPDNQGPVVVTASRPQTKVSYTDDGSALVGSWVVDDVVYGFTESGDKVSFNVTAVDGGTGVATLSQTTSVSLTEGLKVYAIYCPLKSANDIVGGELHIDFSAQEKSVIPMLLASEATVTSGTLSFNFRNLTSIVGIVDPAVIHASSKKFTSVTISGHNLVSSGTVSVVAGQLVFTGDAPSKFITKTLGISDIAHPTVDGARSLAYPIYIVVPAGPIEKLSVLRQGFLFTYDVNKTAEAGKFYKLKDKEFTQVALPALSGVVVDNVYWANCNFGAPSEGAATELGTVHRWGEDVSIATRNGNSGFNFDGEHASGFANYPDEIYWNGSAYTKYTSTDGKTVLDPVDDIVSLTYPGTGWRIPTLAEFNKLDEMVTAGTLTKSYNPGGAIGAQYADASDPDNKKLFFRANQCVSGGGTKTKISGRFWTSSVDTESANKYNAAHFFDAVYASKTCSSTTTGVLYRQYGLTIRPVRKN